MAKKQKKRKKRFISRGGPTPILYSVYTTHIQKRRINIQQTTSKYYILWKPFDLFVSLYLDLIRLGIHRKFQFAINVRHPSCVRTCMRVCCIKESRFPGTIKIAYPLVLRETSRCNEIAINYTKKKFVQFEYLVVIVFR